MKTLLLLCALCASAFQLFALEIVGNGEVFHDCTQLRAVGAELMFTHANGTARVRYDKVPGDLRKKYFTAEQITAFAENDRRSAEAAATAQRAAEKEYAERNEQLARKAARVAAEMAAKEAGEAMARDIINKRRAEHAQRLAKVQSGEWERFKVTFIGPTATGQIVRVTEDKLTVTAHITGGPSMADGDYFSCYAERTGFYEYTNAGGGRSRVRNYVWRGYASSDLLDEMKARSAAKR